MDFHEIRWNSKKVILGVPEMLIWLDRKYFISPRILLTSGSQILKVHYC
jgi:hypothetical protein